MVPTDELQDYPRTSRKKLVVVIAVLVAASLAAYGLVAPAPERDRTALPPFDLPRLDGGRLTDRQLVGSPVVINFWASWCIPCREEAPLLERAWRAYGERGIRVVGVNIRDADEPARAFVEEFGLTYPIVRDRNESLARALGVYGLPVTYFVGRDGNFLARQRGPRLGNRGETVVLGAISEQDLTRRIETLLER